MVMNRYRLTLKHDNGTVTLNVSASSEDAAITQVMTVELCPRSAIQRIEKLK